MHFTAISIVGLFAELLLIISQIPQIYKSFKTKSTEDLSLASIICVVAGIVLWVIYGLIKPDSVIVIANGVSLIAFGTVLYTKIKFS